MTSVCRTAQDGPWDDPATWTGGSVPTQDDDVELSHHVTISDEIYAANIIIKAGGGISVDPSILPDNSIIGHFRYMDMERVLDDNRKVRLDGVCLDPSTVRPSISCIGTYADDGFPTLGSVAEGRSNVIINDPGFYASSAGLRDIRPEGCAPAYTEKATNMVRYINIPVDVPQDELHLLRQLYWMAQGPHQVLAVTHSCVIKGFIESVTPQNTTGANYVRVQVSIAEGSGV